MVILCIDYGARHLGLAITDHEGKIAVRHSVLDGKKDSVLEAVREIVKKERVEKVLVGVPVSLEGRETAQTHECLNFIEDLRPGMDEVAVEGVDETLTSVVAEQNLKAEGRGQTEEHAEAARIMLEDYLNKK